MTLSKRLARLEAERGKGASDMPSVIFLCDAETGEPGAAIIVGGGTISREPDESREAFEARASMGAKTVILLPDNGRDELAAARAEQRQKRDTGGV